MLFHGHKDDYNNSPNPSSRKAFLKHQPKDSSSTCREDTGAIFTTNVQSGSGSRRGGGRGRSASGRCSGSGSGGGSWTCRSGRRSGVVIWIQFTAVFLFVLCAKLLSGGIILTCGNAVCVDGFADVGGHSLEVVLKTGSGSVGRACAGIVQGVLKRESQASQYVVAGNTGIAHQGLSTYRVAVVAVDCTTA